MVGVVQLLSNMLCMYGKSPPLEYKIAVDIVSDNPVTMGEMLPHKLHSDVLSVLVHLHDGVGCQIFRKTLHHKAKPFDPASDLFVKGWVKG